MIMEKIRIWVNAIIHPKKTFAEEKPRASLKKALINYILFLFLLPTILGFCFIFIRYGLDLGISFIFVILIQILIITPFCIFLFFTAVLSNLIAHYIMKFIGGKATFTEQFYLTSLYSPLWLISIILITIAANMFSYDLAILWFGEQILKPDVSFDSVIYNPIIYLLLLLSLFNLYWSTLSTKEAHGQSLIKSAIMALIINLVKWIIIFGIFFILYRLLFSLIFEFLSQGGPAFGLGSL